MKLRAFLATLLILPAFSASAAEEFVGRSTFKVEAIKPANPVREKRNELKAIDKDLAVLNHRLKDVQNQAALAQGLQYSQSGFGHASSLKSLASAYELQQSQLVARRAELRTELEAKK